MKTTMFIPEKIKVGFQKRDDTYTKKLAYVIYFDEKGKLRKETSWENWRDSKISAEDFDNVPTEGFVLNKKVGDYSWHFHRMAYIRVYDPRGFEFEISVQNLLYILEYCTCIPGKGLTGTFVYAWDGPELVLLPTKAKEYQEIQSYTSQIKNSEFVKPKDFKIGFIYKTKKNQKYVYLGKFNYYDFDGTAKMQHHFVWADCFEKMINDKNPDCLWVQNYASLSGKFLEECGAVDKDKIQAFFDLYRQNKHFSPIDDTKTVEVPYTFAEFEAFCDNPSFYSNEFFSKTKNLVFVCKDRQTPVGCFKLKNNVNSYLHPWLTNTNGLNYFTIKEVFDMIQPYYKKIYLTNGSFYCFKVSPNTERKKLI